jgi:ABC-2 type transport system permease protein
MYSCALWKEDSMSVNEQPTNGNRLMQLEVGAGWQRGIRNVLNGELKRWFNTRTWWSQILIWAASINLIFLMVALSAKRAGTGGGGLGTDSIMIFNIFLGLVGPIGISIIMQSAVVGEKRSGTAAWVLSKPVSRTAFILSKLIAYTLGITVTMVLAQGLIAYLIEGLVVGEWLQVGGFLAALAVHLANILFYLTLTLMLGTIFEHGAPVIGIPLAVLFSQNFIASIYPELVQYLPWTLAIPPNNTSQLSLTAALMMGAPLPPLTPLYTVLVSSVIFVAVGLWVFNRQEL